MLGRITGKNVTELRFRIGPDEAVHLGEILVVEPSPGMNGPFYLRVTDLEYGTEAKEAQWGERMAGAMTAHPDTELFDRDERLYRVAVAAPLGYLIDGRFRRPKTLPALFSQVRRPIAGDFGFLAPKSTDLELGTLRSGQEPLPDKVGLDPRALSQHVGIFATTGMGKSNLLKVLAGSCLDSGQIGLLLLDPHGEYADGGAGTHPDGTPLQGLLHHPQKQRLAVYTSRPIVGHPARVFDLKVAAQEIRPGDYANVYHVTGPQEEALWAIFQKWKTEWLTHLAYTDVEELHTALAGKFHEGTLNVLKRRAEQILGQSVIHADREVSTTKEILNHLGEGRVVLVDTSGLYPTEELLVSAVLARSLLDRHRDAYRNPEAFRKLPPVCVTLEEAQRVLNARGGSGNVFAQIAREGRKFKVGLGAVTQQPRLVADELLSQFNTLLILGLADPTDRDRVRGGARQDLSQVGKEIQMLEPGEALLTTPGAPFAIPLMAHLFESNIKSKESDAAVVLDEDFY